MDRRSKFPRQRGGRDRGKFGSRGSYGGQSWNVKPEDEIKPEGDLIATIIPDSAETGATSKAPKIESSKCVASYNWLEKQSGTMLIPGAPPRWTPLSEAITLNQDSGDYFRDPNAARWPRCPTEPTIHALLHQKADFDLAELDIVGCGSTLGNLMRFAASKERSFHFRAELVGKTLFLARQEKSPTALIEGVYGYGHTFPEAYTTWDREVKGSASHQRLVKYDFGGLKIVVRSETDGYLPDKLPTASHASPSQVEQGNVRVDSLVDSLNEASMTTKHSAAASKLAIQVSDNVSIPQEAIFDLKTRTASREYDMEEILPRLWLNRTPNFVIGYHTRGLFNDVRVLDVRVSVAEWEQRNTQMLKNFHSVLQELVNAARDLPKGRFGVWRIGTGNLELRHIKDTKWSVLPTSLKARWSSDEVEDFTDEDSDDGKKEEDLASEDSDDDNDFLKF